jgi:serine protease
MKKRYLSVIAMTLLGVGVVSCGGPSPTRGSLSGTISPGKTKAQSVPPSEFVAGQVVVKFRSGIRVQNLTTLQAGQIQLARVRSLGVPQAALFKAKASSEQTLEMVRILSARADVEYAEVNRIYHPLSVPTDPLYVRQWHYEAMNLPAAWAISTGVASTVVAVADDGILFDKTNEANSHPDFIGKVIGGYDFISDPASAGDGNGRDDNPYDNLIGLHGTHVAGTIAAATNNNQFGAGVNWEAKLLNIRVLGKSGGDNTDIVDGILWAGGEPIAGIANNANPAKVINMSLGGDGACSKLEQDAFNLLAGKGVIVVVAAGNENENVNKPKSPANCANVITVGATGPTNRRAPYSNFGPRVDVMAPGGDTSLSVNRGGTDFEGGVFSTYSNKAGNVFNLSSIQGTSMASPHIAGLVSLMVGINPNLTLAQTLQFLKDNAKPLEAGACSNDNAVVKATDCGAGLVDAAKTLEKVKDALGGSDTPTPPAPPAPPVTKATENYVMAENQDNPAESKQVKIALTGAPVKYKIDNLAPGNYKLVAYNDLDGDAKPDATEPTVSKNEVVKAGEENGDEDLEMEPDN